MAPKKTPRSEYLRQRFLRTGPEGFTPKDALELLLGYCLSGQKLYSAIDNLFYEYHSLENILSADIKDLEYVPEMTENSAALIAMVLKSYRVYEMEHRIVKINNAEEACRYFMDLYCGVSVERFALACLNQRSSVYRIIQCGEGTTYGVNVDLEKIIRSVRISKCTRCYLCHNHPGGSFYPSAADIDSTKFLSCELENIGCKVIDHIIVARDGARAMFSEQYVSNRGEVF